MTKDTSGLSKKKSGKGLPLGLFSIITLLAICAGLFFLLKDTTPPAITIAPEATLVGKETSVTVKADDPGSGLKSLEIVAVQNGKRIPLAVKDYPGGIMQA